MKKLILSAVIFFPLLAATQNLHVGVRLGLANYQGDLQQRSFTFNQAKFAGSLGLKYDLTEHLVARTFLTLTSLQGNDARNSSTALQERNLQFATRLWEWELSGQYNIFNLNDRWWTPYVFAGVSLFHFKPYANDAGGNKVFLQPLSTEGQGFIAGRDPYKSTQIAIPFGIGAEYALNEDMKLGLELGYRRTFTDYLDDVSTTYVDEAQLLAARGSQAVAFAYRGTGSYPVAGTVRGNAGNKDAFYFVQLTFTIRPYVDWYRRTSGISSFKKTKRIGCPSQRF